MHILFINVVKGIGMQNNQPLLSICIPTYNRASILDGNLAVVYEQIKGKDFPIEVIVSDNCSSDNTSFIVNKYITDGMKISYIRNNVNTGMDGNFAQCYRRANGKYILVLGDDDYLIDGKLEKLINYLRKGDYGLVHLKTNSNSSSEEVFYDPEKFLQNISYWITYITSNIINSKYIEEYNFEQYFGTYLTIVPLYLAASIKHEKNLIISERIFADGIVSNTNGGYNFFEVFSENYLRLWRTFVSNGQISSSLYRFIKHDIYKRFLIPNIYYLLIKKDVNNYRLENSWGNLLKQYAFCSYFYFDPLIFITKSIAIKIFRKQRKITSTIASN